LEDAGPSPTAYWGEPAAAAIDAKTGRLFVYSRGEVAVLAVDANGKYKVDNERQMIADEKTSAVLAAGGGKCFLILKDGKIVTLSDHDLATTHEQRLPGESPPREAAVAPDGKRLFILSHDGVLHAWDLASDKFSRARVRGQGDISALTVTPDGKLYIASQATRVTEYDLTTMKERHYYGPTLNVQERTYYYGIQPAHAYLPKPGEFYKTVQYLLVGKQTSGTNEENLASAQAKLDPWSPIYSGLAFQAVMLLLGCLYIQWQEF